MKRGMTRREREVTDKNEIIKILDHGKIVHVGMVDDGKPYVVPMNYGYTLEDDKLTLYLHGATEGRKLDIIRKNPDVFIEIDTDIIPFTGETACHYGIGYSSIMGEGVAELIEDVELKKAALSLLMKTQTGEDFTFTDKMVNVVAIIKLTISDYTAKKRPLPPLGQR